MAITLSEAERAYFVRKLGGTQLPTKPLNQIKREYFAAAIGGATANIPFNELELRWILKTLSDASLTVTNANSQSELWKNMVLSIPLAPTKRIDQNKLIFYINAA